MDLTKIIETQSFTFDDAFDCTETNEMMYGRTIAPLVAFLFDGGKASCFAYGQTGSGTFKCVYVCRVKCQAMYYMIYNVMRCSVTKRFEYEILIFF